MRLLEDDTRLTMTRSADDPVILAKHAIALLDRKLSNTYGLRAEMGAELEFAVLPIFGSTCDKEFGLPDAAAPSYGCSASVSRTPALRDPWFPESRRVNRSYRESPSNGPWKQMEVVLTHRPQNADGSPVPTSNLTLARTIEALRHQIREPKRGKKNTPTTSDHGNQYYVKYLRDQVDTLRMDATIAGSFVQNGLHLNVSLSDATGRPFFSSQESIDRMRNGLGLMAEENLYLLGSSYNTITRWQQQYGDHSTTFFNQFKTKCGPDGSYIENRLPAADSNPYYAVLLTLAGIDYTLAHRPANAIEDEMPTQPMGILTPALLHRQFTQGTLLRATLNDLEPQLGDRFCLALRRVPPGCETQQQRY